MEESDVAKICRDYFRLCRETSSIVRAIERGEITRLSDVAAYLHVRLKHVSVQCQCDPPGCGEEFCTGHCER